MRTIIMLSAFLFIVGSASSVMAQGESLDQEMQSQSSTPAQAGEQGDINQNQPSMQTQGAEGQGFDEIIRGTIVGVDPVNNNLTITDYVSGIDRTFQVDSSADLEDLEEGDQVNVTQDQNDPSKAQSVEKSDSQL